MGLFSEVGVYNLLKYLGFSALLYFADDTP